MRRHGRDRRSRRSAAPAQFVHAPLPGLPSAEGRLIEGLREAAQTKDAMEILARAAEVFYRAVAAEHTRDHRARQRAGRPGDDRPRGLQELAGLWRLAGERDVAQGDHAPSPAVVGHDRRARRRRRHRRSTAPTRWPGRCAGRPHSGRPPARRSAGSPSPGRTTLPHRPVNLPAPRLASGFELEQFEIQVSVRGRDDVRTRFFISSAVEDAAPRGDPRGDPRAAARPRALGAGAGTR